MAGDKKTDGSGQHFAWDEGLPTKPDIDLLLKTFPDLVVGDRVPYEEVEAALGISRKRNRNRWTTVTDGWRKRMQEQNLVIECKKDSYFYVADCDQITAMTHGVVSTIERKARVHQRKLNLAPAETEEQRKRVAHDGRLVHELQRFARESKRTLLPSAAMAAMPQVVPPNDSDG